MTGVQTCALPISEGIVRFLRTKKAPDGTPLRRPASPSAGEDGSAGAEAPGEGEEALEEEPLPAPPQPQLPEGIVKFLKSKKAPDGTLAHPDLPPVVPVKLPSTQSSPSSPEENREAALSPESV